MSTRSTVNTIKKNRGNFEITMNAAYLFALLLGVIICNVTIVAGTEQVIDGEDICRLHKDGTVLLKPGYCNRGIKCQDFKSVDLASPICSGNTPNFNPSTSKCVKKEQFEVCNANKNPCTKNSPEFINDPYTCDGWFACDKKTRLNAGKCPEYMYFDEGKQMCVYSSQTTCTATYEYCDVTPVNMQFRDPKNCTQYLVCVKDKLKIKLSEVACPKDTFFDVTTGKCVKSAMSVCDEIPLPWQVCGSEKLAIRNQFVSDRATCRGYYYCRDTGTKSPDTKPYWYQCPENTFFVEDWQACIDRAQVRCKYDRCDGRKSGYELSETYGCQHYYECEDDVIKSSQFKCNTNMYFDAYKRTCTSTWTSYGACS